MPIEFLLGNEEQLQNVRNQKPKCVFEPQTMAFLAAAAGRLGAAARKEHLTDLAALAFWCRRGHLEQLKQQYTKEELRVGRGFTVHFAPGNIPTQFAYTAAAGLLAGNCVLVRLSSRKTRQEEVILQSFRQTIGEEFPEFSGRLFFCRYEHSREITDALSTLCDVRVMWGSDASVQEIRRSPLLAGATELPFAARDSAAVFSAEAVCGCADLDALCRNFYNDTYLNDQNACSSPHILYWIGAKERVRQAQERFWDAFSKFLESTGWEVQAGTAVKKYAASLRIAAQSDSVKILHRDNAVVRIQVPELHPDLWNDTEPGGMFIEADGESLLGLLPVLNKTCQTLSTFGISPKEVGDFLRQHPVSGADRIVPVGHTLDFDLTWDGFDLIGQMSRKIAILQ